MEWTPLKYTKTQKVLEKFISAEAMPAWNEDRDSTKQKEAVRSPGFLGKK